MNLQFQSTLKDLIVKLSWFLSVSLGFVSFRFVEYNKPCVGHCGSLWVVAGHCGSL